MKVIAFIGVGSNINPKQNIMRALIELEKNVKVLDISTHYSTRAEMRPVQPNYINGVWKIETDISAVELKYEVLKKIEYDMGRKREEDKYASRRIDLDILLYGNNVINNDKISIPDKNIYKRAFICIPIHELESGLVLPDTNKSLSSIVKGFENEVLTPLTRFTEQLKNYLGEKH